MDGLAAKQPNGQLNKSVSSQPKEIGKKQTESQLVNQQWLKKCGEPNGGAEAGRELRHMQLYMYEQV